MPRCQATTKNNYFELRTSPPEKLSNMWALQASSGIGFSRDIPRFIWNWVGAPGILPIMVTINYVRAAGQRKWGGQSGDSPGSVHSRGTLCRIRLSTPATSGPGNPKNHADFNIYLTPKGRFWSLRFLGRFCHPIAALIYILEVGLGLT